MDKMFIYKVKSWLFSLVLCIIATIIMVAIFFGAVLQQSYRDYPPTEEELRDDPALIKYVD